MEKIPSTMVLHKHVDGADTRFATVTEPLVNNLLGKWLRVIRIVTYQAASGDSRGSYDPVYGLCTDTEPDSDSSNDGSSDEGRK